MRNNVSVKVAPSHLARPCDGRRRLWKRPARLFEAQGAVAVDPVRASAKGSDDYQYLARDDSATVDEPASGALWGPASLVRATDRMDGQRHARAEALGASAARDAALESGERAR